MDSQQLQSSSRNIFRFILAGLPTFLVLGSIAAIAYFGHHNGWKVPKFSQLFGNETKTTEDWCQTHNVPDSRCIACHPELAGESSADWCKEHGVPESKCTACHPEILTKGVAGDWCREHGLPESGCTICHPEIARKGELPTDKNAVNVSKDTGASSRPADPSGTSSANASKSVPDPSTCQTHTLKVQFASLAAMDKCGIRLENVVDRPMADAIEVNAQVEYDQTRFAKIASRVAGTVRRVDRDLGEIVRAGDVLAIVDSAEVGRAKAELLQAQSAVDVTARALKRVRASSEAGFRTEAERLEAEANASAAEIRLFNARQALGNLGLVVPTGTVNESQIVTLGVLQETLNKGPNATLSANLIPLTASFDGVVVARDVVTGTVVDPSRTLFEIADTSRMWITMDIPEVEAQRVKLEQSIIFRPDYAPDVPTRGRVSWMSTALDETTRTVKVRAEVQNTGGTLRAHSFGRARIVIRTSPEAISVPTEAIQWEGCCNIVFVRIGEGIFQTRKVRLGARDAAYTEILGGVLTGEVVVTTGSHVLKSEIQKSKLGAGCCDEK